MSKTPEQSPRAGKTDPVQILGTATAEDAFTSQLLGDIFSVEGQLSEASADGAGKAVSLANLDCHLDNLLEEELVHQNVTESEEQVAGRLGPKGVTFQFDINTNVGTLIVDPDRLGLSSQSNFSSMRANCCVFKGKWVYEVMLGSKGVMQIGWCTVNCKFSQEEGVGDTKDSYAYDGSRQRKWNATTQKYGEGWYTGDVITCTIDCDVGSICFYRNGKSLGEAFSTVRLGPGYAYFPAVSLSLNENLRANFGATPLRYPVPGFAPLQSPPRAAMVKTDMLLGHLEKMLHMSFELEKESKCDGGCVVGADSAPAKLTETRSKPTSLLLLIASVFEKLAPLLKSTYVIEASLMRLFLKLNDSSIVLEEQPLISRLLDYMWAFMQSFEIKACLENLMISLLSAYRFYPVATDFHYPKIYLTLTLAILRHQLSRKYLLENELFDKGKFPMFMHIKPLDDAGLEELTPTVWWDMDTQETEDPVEDVFASRKSEYMKSCDELRIRVEELEFIQIELLKVLMIHKNDGGGKTSRLMFIEKFRKFLKETMSMYLNMWPLPVTLCFFHRLVRALRHYWDDFQKDDPSRFVPSTEAFMPIQEFWSDERDYFNFQRCGGSMSHLNRILGSEVNKAQGVVVEKDGQVSMKAEKGSDYPKTEMPTGNSLMEVLDGLVILYHTAAHKQLGKMNSLRDNMQEFVQSYKDTIKKLTTCPEEMGEVREELERAKAVFMEKITEQARHMSWVRAVVYSKKKQEDVAWLLGVSLKTVSRVSQFKLLFQYLPEFYLETVIHSYNALKNYFHPTMPFHTLPDYTKLMRGFAEFLTGHFSDGRIVITDTRDVIIQSLASFTCYEQSLRVLESLPEEKCTFLLRHLIAPYENRSWAQTNWILVRIWKGCGFGFRFTHLPHLVPSKVQLTEFGTASLQKPCPSPQFQGLLAGILKAEPDLATRFLDTLLNQLNWSFSEFIGMMQEIQQLITRTERRVFLEGRQLKMCGTFFEISVCLFRVLEMAVTIAPSLFTDWSRPSAELLMNRLIQLICLVLNRITLKHGMFDNVVAMYITGLESVTHYPMLAVVAGILNTLVLKTGSHCQKVTTQILLSDQAFQIISLEFMLGHQAEGATAVKAGTGKKENIKEKVFSFRNYTEVSEDELGDLEGLIAHVKSQEETFVRAESHIREEDLCNICYASQQSAIFKPCGHMSCRSCISHQLLIKKECFFCKAIINSIEDLKGQPIMLDSPSKI